MAGLGMVFWLVLIVAAGIVAQRKGRSGEKWAMATALLGPLAFFVLLSMDAVPVAELRPKMTVEVEITLRLCPQCRSLLPSGATACRSCRPLPDASLGPCGARQRPRKVEQVSKYLEASEVI